MKQVRLHRRAVLDIEDAAAYYQAEAEKGMAECFARAVEAQLVRIAEFPALGSLRFSMELGIPQLRSSAVSSFPFSIFYMETSGSLNIVRVLHNSRDIPAAFRLGE